MADTNEEEYRVEQYFRQASIKDWRGFLEIYNDCIRTGKSNQQWIFRGQRDHKWDLKTSLERALDSFDLKITRASKYEKILSRQFKRHFNNYSTNIPEKEDELE